MTKKIPMFCYPLVTVLLVLMHGCSSLPTDYPRPNSTVLSDHESTPIGKSFADEAATHPGESGFTIVRHGREAFTARIALTRLATKTLDVQYYIWEPDDTGRILADQLVRAADRGVRVRLLVDDMSAAGRDAVIASLSVHPNIEIRIFNPFSNRNITAVDFLTDFSRVNRRMHNKIMVMDNAIVIVGGRNIGDHYFAVNPETNFRDLDIAAAGPVVRDVSKVFDRFWNGDWAVPIEALVERPYTQDDLQNSVSHMRQKIAAGSYPYSLEDDTARMLDTLATIRSKLIWAPGVVVWDDPSTVTTGEQPGVMLEALHRKVESLKRELAIESAYFIIGTRGRKAFQQMCDRGIKIRVLTNSLASNDVIAAHAGHAEFRKELLQTCAQIYEVRPDSAMVRKGWEGKTMAGLHTKAMVFDRESIFIGSFNLDPRSAVINTEAGLYVDSPELAEQVLAYLDEGISPANSYHVKLDEKGKLYWETIIDGVTVRYDDEPETTFWQRLQSDFIELLPVESQL